MNPQQDNDTNKPNGSQAPLMPSEPPKGNDNKNLFTILAVVVAIIILGVIAFAVYNGSKKDTKDSSTNNTNTSTTNNNADQSSDKYQKYEVTDVPSGRTFSVQFYKDARVEQTNGRTYLNSGESGSLYSVYLGVATGDTLDCGNSPTTTMTLGSESTTVCYDSDGTQYAGYAKTNSGLVKINLAGQQPISLEEAKTIMESVTF